MLSEIVTVEEHKVDSLPLNINRGINVTPKAVNRNISRAGMIDKSTTSIKKVPVSSLGQNDIVDDYTSHDGGYGRNS